MRSGRKTYTALQKELASQQTSVFVNSMALLMSNIRTKYEGAREYLLTTIKESRELFALKAWHVEYFNTLPNLRKQVEDSVYADMIEDEQIAGTFQNSQAQLRFHFETIYMLVNYLKFTVQEAEDIHVLLLSLTDITGREADILRNFLAKGIYELIQEIINVMQKEQLSAEAAHKEILTDMAPINSRSYTLNRVLISKALYKQLNENSQNKNVAEIIFNQLKLARIIENSQEKNRMARCFESTQCAYNKKYEVYARAGFIALLDENFFVEEEDQERMLAIETSMAVDHYSCNKVAEYGFAPAFRRAASLPHNLGFFAKSISAGVEIKPVNKSFTFYPMFHSLMQTLVTTCKPEQFISVAALGLLIPAVNNTMEALTGSELSGMMRLGM
jgi:hypothetical protein